jgi:hypothetical protein
LHLAPSFRGCAMTPCTTKPVPEAIENKELNRGSCRLERVKNDAMFQA